MCCFSGISKIQRKNPSKRNVIIRLLHYQHLQFRFCYAYYVGTALAYARSVCLRLIRRVHFKYFFFQVVELSSETRRGETVKMTVTLTRELPASSPVCMQVFSIIFKK